MKHRFIAKRYWKEQTTAMGQSDVMAKSFNDVINSMNNLAIDLNFEIDKED